jgi:hypothetical protein
MESLLAFLRVATGCCYLGLVVGRRGFQSGCEETAKRCDIALIPPLTGNTDWLKLITREEILERVRDAVRALLLFGVHWLSASSRGSGDFYNEVFVVAREPSGLPGTTKIAIPNGENITLSDLIRAALKEPENQLVIPLRRNRELHPLFKPVEVTSLSPDGSVRSYSRLC